MNSGWGKPAGTPDRPDNQPAIAPETAQAVTRRLAYLREQLKTATAKADYATQESTQREIVSLTAAVSGADSPSTFVQRGSHVNVLLNLDQPEALTEARSLAERCLAVLGPGHEMTFHARDSLLRAMAARESPVSVVDPAKAAFDDASRIFGRRSLITLRSQSTYARSLTMVGRFAESLDLCGELREAMSSFVTPNATVQDSIDMTHRLALVAAGRFTEALEKITSAAELMAKKYGTSHPSLHLFRVQHAQLLNFLGDPHTAAAEARQAADVFAAHFGPEHSNTLVAYVIEGRSLVALGKTAEAVDATRYAYEHLLWRWGRPHFHALTAGVALCEALTADGRADEALGLARVLAGQSLQEFGPEHYLPLTARRRAAEALVATGDVEQGRKELAVSLADHIRVLGNDHPYTERCRQAQPAA